jgi:hypothetical protein
LVQTCVRRWTGKSSTKGERQRERKSFLMAATATVRVVVVFIYGGSDRESHSRQAF